MDIKAILIAINYVCDNSKSVFCKIICVHNTYQIRINMTYYTRLIKYDM